MSIDKKPGDLWREGKDPGLHTNKVGQRDKLARELAESVLKALMEGLPSNKGERGIVTQQLCDMARQLLKLYSDK